MLAFRETNVALGAEPSERPASAVASVSVSSRVAVSVVGSDETLHFLLGELAFLGLEPIALSVAPNPDFDALERLAREGNFAALLHVDRQRAQVHVSVLDRMTGKMSARRLDADHALTPRDVAIRSVELLRASLLELGTSKPPEQEVEAPRQLVPSAPVVRSRWGLMLSGSVLAAPGGLSPFASLRLSVWRMLHPRVGLMLGGGAPLSAARVRAPEGLALVRIGSVVFGSRIALAPEHRWFRPSLTLAAGPIFLAMEGRANPPFRGGEAFVVSGIAEAELNLDFALASQWRLRVGGVLGTCFTRPEVVFAGRSVAPWCLPYGGAQVGLGVEW